MLVGWLQGKRILDMFTIGVRYLHVRLRPLEDELTNECRHHSCEDHNYGVSLHRGRKMLRIEIVRIVYDCLKNLHRGGGIISTPFRALDRCCGELY